ncbi:uncharacterized protein LAESUDRAFT_717378 [Laetiporus sulphureus 93-53]|uniref:Uncharacterized protein n=1 Tax=Laetiporus sulphureus 93-53 TaxID=1314785 RepID=A0A165BSX0_9APHY|nr:uncharacterized protein LAESUDRAFT_717378 [Laetiporus sulphureus 93-53]KZT01588.1 hypothetical protein LAESUDRAFT_717378 [Laetiporus sulphureus 93-53]
MCRMGLADGMLIASADSLHFANVKVQKFIKFLDGKEINIFFVRCKQIHPDNVHHINCHQPCRLMVIGMRSADEDSREANKDKSNVISIHQPLDNVKKKQHHEQNPLFMADQKHAEHSDLEWDVRKEEHRHKCDSG